MNNINESVLQRYDCNGLELIIDRTSGAVYASQKAIARMVEKNESTIRYWIGAQNIPIQHLKIPTTGGFQGAQLLDEDAIYESFAKYKPELLIQCAKAGIRVYLHRLAGFHVTSEAIQPVDKMFAKEFLDSLWNDIEQSFPEIDKRLIKGAKLNGLSKHYPEFASELQQAKHLISATSSEEKLPMSPTELGIIFAQKHSLNKVSAQVVNKALLIEGLQIKSEDKLCPYQLTSLGQEYAQLQLETCKGHNKTIYRIRWYEEVINLIEDTLLKLVKT